MLKSFRAPGRYGVLLVPLLAVVLAACGTSAGSPDPAAGRPSGAGGGGAGGPGVPGVSGTIAAVSAGTLQVQDSTSQTTVTYTASTRFSRTASAAVAVGDCVLVTGAAGTTGTAITANSVRIESSGAATCDVAGRRPGGGQPSGGFPTGRFPSRAPGGGQPSGAPGNGRDFTTVAGRVASVAGSTVVVDGTLRSRTGAIPTPTASPAAVPVTVTLGAGVAVTRTVAATAAAATVGRCATALGKADDSGTVAATAITLSDPGPGGCAARFGGRRGGGTGNGGTGNG
jgi:hypothetical protein